MNLTYIKDCVPLSQQPDDFWGVQQAPSIDAPRRAPCLAWVSIILAIIASPVIVLPLVVGLDTLLWRGLGWGSADKDAITQPIAVGLPLLSFVVTATARAWNTAGNAKGFRRLTTIALIFNAITVATYLLLFIFLLLLGSGWPD